MNLYPYYQPCKETHSFVWVSSDTATHNIYCACGRLKFSDWEKYQQDPYNTDIYYLGVYYR